MTSSVAASDAPAGRLRTLAGRHVALVLRLARCMAVSIFTSLLSLAVLVGLATGAGMRPWLANVIATAVGTVPSYLLNRRWVWGRSGNHDPWREVLPFWVMSFTGLVVSTVAVDRAGAWATSAALGPGWRSLCLMVANVGSFGLLWVAQFLLLDRVLFGRKARA